MGTSRSSSSHRRRQAPHLSPFGGDAPCQQRQTHAPPMTHRRASRRCSADTEALGAPPLPGASRLIAPARCTHPRSPTLPQGRYSRSKRDHRRHSGRNARFSRCPNRPAAARPELGSGTWAFRVSLADGGTYPLWNVLARTERRRGDPPRHRRCPAVASLRMTDWRLEEGSTTLGMCFPGERRSDLGRRGDGDRGGQSGPASSPPRGRRPLGSRATDAAGGLTAHGGTPSGSSPEMNAQESERGCCAGCWEGLDAFPSGFELTSGRSWPSRGFAAQGTTPRRTDGCGTGLRAPSWRARRRTSTAGRAGVRSAVCRTPLRNGT